jgi:hypothetical protein
MSWFSLIGFLFLGYIAINVIAYVIANNSYFTEKPLVRNIGPLSLATAESLNNNDIKLKALESITVKPIFKSPFEYIGMPTKEALKTTAGIHNLVTNGITIDSKQATMMLESDNNIVSFVEVEFKNAPLCSQQVPFDPELILSALGMNFSALELATKQTHLYVYYYHERKLKISVSCGDYGHFAVHISSKYYGM